MLTFLVFQKVPLHYRSRQNLFVWNQSQTLVESMHYVQTSRWILVRNQFVSFMVVTVQANLAM